MAVRRFRVCLSVVALSLAWSTFTANELVGQPFSSIISVPPEQAPGEIGGDTQLNLFDGGVIDPGFNAGNRAGTSVNVQVNISGGSVGDDFRANGGSRISISGGNVGDNFVTEFAAVDIAGGVFGKTFIADRGARVNLSGGTISDIFKARSGSMISITGQEFRIGSGEVPGLEPGVPYLVDQRNVRLSGLLGDGTPFTYVLLTADADDRDHLHADARLSLCLVNEVVPDCLSPHRFTWELVDGGNGHTYEFVPTGGSVSWDWARADAEFRSFEGVDGHLATITSEQENDFVFATFSKWMQPSIPGSVSGDKIWIGLSDHDVEGEYRWITGEPFDYANWHDGEPNNLGDEDYVHLQTKLRSGAIRYGWNDEDSSSALIGYLVEYDVVPEPNGWAWIPLICVGLCGWGRLHIQGACSVSEPISG